MRQRLALAIALITNPEFLILDEPVNGLDPKGIIEIRNLMLSLVHERGLTLLVSSHLLDELSQVATHYGIIDKGRLIKQLSAAELEEQLKQHIRIITKDSEKATALLKSIFHVEDCLAVSQNELRIGEQLDRVGEMHTMLVQNGIVVQSIGVTEGRLEEYFVRLTGGMRS
jgi:ABC-2 type transport system ATP-binding protein